ncbi:MAG: hypothetical protein M1822_008210 [Bathelium mastoideum]|nr:MAG: hypothetical protein M1822_008210 [Bathelium mastoideum]
MQQILDPDKPGQKGVVLYGIGGSGKTQLALNFIMKTHRQYSAVLWINASTIQQMNHCFSELVDILDSKWPSPDMPLTYSGPINWKKVVSRLRSTRYPRWLLIIDSVDDLNSENYRDYIPSCRHGSVIITSTQAQAAEVFRMEPLLVDGLDIQSSSELLLSGILGQTEPQEPSDNDRMLAISISKELNGFPLAIEQAAALIRRTSVSLSNFLSAYRSNYHTLMDFYPSRGLLAYDKNRPLTNVFDMLHNTISVQNPGASALLNFIAILGSCQVPMTVIDGFQLHENRTSTHVDDVQALQRILSNSIDLRHALMFLVESCLLKVKYHKDGSWKSISLHRAVCDWCIEIMETAKRAWIVGVAYELAIKVLDPAERDLNPWPERSVAILRPCVAPLDRSISLIRKYIPEEDVSLPTGRFYQKFNFITAQVAEVYLIEGRSKEAEMQLSRLIDIKRTSQEHEWSNSKEALQLLLRLARVLHQLGDLDQSRETYDSALSISEKWYGHDDERTGMVYNLLRGVDHRRDVMRLHHKSALIATTDRGHEKGIPGPSCPRHLEEDISDSQFQSPDYDDYNDDRGDLATTELCVAAAEGNNDKFRRFFGLEPIHPNYVDRGVRDVMRLRHKSALIGPTDGGREKSTPGPSCPRHLQEDVSELQSQPPKTDGYDDDRGDPACAELCVAAAKGDIDRVRQFLGLETVDPNSVDRGSRTALLWATMRGHDEMARLLLERNDIQPHLSDKFSTTPLYWAARIGRKSIVRLLLEREDVDVNWKACGSLTPLHSAAHLGQEAVVQLLLEHKDIDVNSKTDGGPTPLFLAAHSGDKAVVQLPLPARDIDFSEIDGGQTPLHLATRSAEKAVIQLLLQSKDIDVNSKTNNGLTPLHLAICSGWGAVVQLLLEHKDIDVNSRTGSGSTPLHLAAQSGHETVVQLLLEYKDVNINLKNRSGLTLLHVAASSGQEAVVQLLLKHEDIDVNIKSKTDRGSTPLRLAADSGHETVVRLLIRHKDISIHSWGGM